MIGDMTIQEIMGLTCDNIKLPLGCVRGAICTPNRSRDGRDTGHQESPLSSYGQAQPTDHQLVPKRTPHNGCWVHTTHHTNSVWLSTHIPMYCLVAEHTTLEVLSGSGVHTLTAWFCMCTTRSFVRFKHTPWQLGFVSGQLI